MTDYLAIYLRDQLALALAWRELAERSARSNRGSPVGEALGEVATGMAEDVRTFQRLMSVLGVRPNPVKLGLAVVAERVGRLKTNGRLLKYSPLSRFVELDMLSIGIQSKKQLWATLRDIAGLAGRVPDVNFDDLIHRARQQHERLDPFRVDAGTETLRDNHA